MLRFSLACLVLPKDRKEYMELVKSLRYRTEAPIMDCTSALKESDGDIDAAMQLLHTKGLARAMKKANSVTEHGFLVSCVSPIPRNGAAIITMCSETDFAARNAHFQQLCRVTQDRLVAMLDQSAGGLLAHPAEATEALNAAMDDVLRPAIAVLGENVRVRAVTPLLMASPTLEGLRLGCYVHGGVGVEEVGRLVGLIAVEHRTGVEVEPEVLTSVARHFVATSGAEGDYAQENFFGTDNESFDAWMRRHHLRFNSSLVMEFGKDPIQHIL
ncbi:unnamed protein product [Phytomonas sp. Hart1]|nr:unnamed protein product [Phytomonas sp. Hart1]|eukprot:CCW67427.1 unnamed protein product [Phytomonas sp. isolate Hart1]